MHRSTTFQLRLWNRSRWDIENFLSKLEIESFYSAYRKVSGTIPLKLAIPRNKFWWKVSLETSYPQKATTSKVTSDFLYKKHWETTVSTWCITKGAPPRDTRYNHLLRRPYSSTKLDCKRKICFITKKKTNNLLNNSQNVGKKRGLLKSSCQVSFLSAKYRKSSWSRSLGYFTSFKFETTYHLIGGGAVA